MNSNKILLTITEGGMILYWIFAALVALEFFKISPEYMYSDYTNPILVAWNWSFFPIDIIFATTGLFARFGNITESRQTLLSMFSLSLMFCAGLMAISFWVVQGSFEPFWWLINLWLVLLASWVLLKNYRTHC